MKLAEALVLRADVQKRLAQLSMRLQQSALVQEGEQPPEKPADLLVELEQLLEQLNDLIARINRTNLEIRLADGATLTDALARRDVLTQRYSIIDGLATAASNRVQRYGRAEIRMLSTVDVADLRRQLSEIARQRRELDTAIQAANWNSDLIE